MVSRRYRLLRSKSSVDGQASAGNKGYFSFQFLRHFSVSNILPATLAKTVRALVRIAVASVR
jgi:hypothetical protein